MKKIFLFITLMVFTSISYCQGTVELPATVKTKQIQRTGEKRENGKMLYYTVLISFGQNKDEAYKMQSKFNEKYKNSPIKYSTNIQWEDPYFKLYAGKFMNAIDAQKLISELRGWLVNVILVKKELDYQEIKE